VLIARPPGRGPLEQRGRKRQPECLQDLGRLGGGQREAGLHDRRPLLQAVGVDLAQQLDVHQRIANLDVGALGRKQIDLVAVLRAFGW